MIWLSYKLHGAYVLLGPSGGQEPIKFIAPEFVSCLEGRRVLCVGNGWHFCEIVLMNKSNITFEVARLSIWVFKKCSEKIYSWYYIRHDIIFLKSFDWNNVGPASQTVTQHYISFGPIYVLSEWWPFWRRGVKCHQHSNELPANTGQLPNVVSMLGQRRRLRVNIETAYLGEYHALANVLAQSIQQTHCWISVGPAL